jgi:hypothetical protein
MRMETEIACTAQTLLLEAMRLIEAIDDGAVDLPPDADEQISRLVTISADLYRKIVSQNGLTELIKHQGEDHRNR